MPSVAPLAPLHGAMARVQCSQDEREAMWTVHRTPNRARVNEPALVATPTEERWMPRRHGLKAPVSPVRSPLAG